MYQQVIYAIGNGATNALILCLLPMPRMDRIGQTRVSSMFDAGLCDTINAHKHLNATLTEC